MSYFIVSTNGVRVPVQLGQRIGGGASGEVFRSPDLPSYLLKVYKGGDSSVSREKIEAMLAASPDLPPLRDKGAEYPQLAWPEAILENARGEMVGFMMPEIDLHGSVPLTDMLQKKSRQYAKLPEAYKIRAIIAKNLASLFVKIHHAGHSMIDIKPENIRLYRSTMYLAILDCDGFAIRGIDGTIHPAQHISNDYIAPESFLKSPSECGRDHDLFALAVLFFQLLNNGIHPFQGIPRDPARSLGTIDERVKQNIYCYGYRSHPLQMPSPQSIHAYLEDETLALFERAFTTKVRPSAAEWDEHLGRVLGKLRFCKVSREHAHFSKRCGFCQIEKRNRKAAKRRGVGPFTRVRQLLGKRPLPTRRRFSLRRITRLSVGVLLLLLVVRLSLSAISSPSPHLSSMKLKGKERALHFPQELLERGRGAYKERRYGDARELYRGAADLGLGQAQYNLALMYLEGKGGPKDLRGARELLRKAAAQGLALAQNKLGDLYWEESNFVKAKEWYERAALLDDPFALNSLGVMHDEGLGIIPDPVRAREYFTRASKKGHHQAQFNLAEMYYRGRGGAQDLRRARELYLKAAAQGHLSAQNMVGLMYYLGEGGETEIKLARSWWERAASEGNKDARENLERHFS